MIRCNPRKETLPVAHCIYPYPGGTRRGWQCYAVCTDQSRERKQTIMQSSNAKVGWSLWLQWVLASILGFAVGAAMGNAVLNSIPPMTCSQSSSDSLIDRL